MAKIKSILKLVAEIAFLAILAFILSLILQQRPNQSSFLSNNYKQIEAYPKPSMNEGPNSSPSPDNIQSGPYPPPGEMGTPETPLTKPPECTFTDSLTDSLSVVQLEKPPFENYQFSKPKIVFTSTQAINLANWLPDSQHLLSIIDSQNGKQAVEILDTNSGETRIYGNRGNTGGKPVWIDSLQAVIYPSSTPDRQELLISYGDPQKIQQISSDIYNLSLSSNGKQLAFTSPPSDMPQVWDANTKAIYSTDLNLAGWNIDKLPKKFPNFSVPGMRFITHMNPRRSLIAFDGYGTLLLGEPSTKKICEINLGSNGLIPNSIIYAVWSPNGQYLAMITTAHYPGQVARYSKLSVLDILTGKQDELDLPFPIIEDIAWSADNQTLAALGLMKEDLKIGSNAVSRLFVVDIPSKNYKMIFPDRYFGGGTIVGWQMSWSPDNKWIAVKCPLISDPYQPLSEDRVCLIKVDLYK